MVKARSAHPVSGEIMTAASGGVPNAFGILRADIVDADYEDIGVVPTAAISGQSGSLRGDRDGDGLVLLFQAERQRSGFADRGGPAFWMAGAALIVAAFWISGGHSAVMTALAAPIEPMRSVLTLAGVTSRVDTSGGKPLIFVDGRIRNDGGGPAHLPNLEIRVSDSDGLVTRYKLGTSSQSLASGDEYAFSSRLDAPKNGARTVAVTFAE